MWSLLCIPPLAVMVVSDMRSRRIGMMPLLIFGIALAAASLICRGWRTVALDLAFNLLIIILLWLFLYGYARMRKMRLPEMIGGGDLAFALAVTTYFEPQAYVLFLVVSSSLSLAVWWMTGIVGRRCRGNRPDGTKCRGIPLVTGMGVCLVAVIVYRTIEPFR